MAGFNEILVGRYNRLFQKLLSLKGAANLTELAAEMVPSFPLFSGVENRYLEQWDRFGAGVNSPASAGNFSAAKMFNPTGSNVVVVIEKLTITGINSGAYDVSYGQNQLAYGTLTVGKSLDGRQARGATVSLSTGNNAALNNIGTTIGLANILLQTSWDFVLFEDQEIVLSPGDALQVENQQANSALFVTFLWRERFLEESERK